MPGPSPKRKQTLLKKSMMDQKSPETGSDYRLVIVLGGAIILAIAIIIAVMWSPS